MPDLSRVANNPVSLVVERFKSLPRYASFDIIETPEIVGTYETFDLFGFPINHTARSHSDTYYASDDKILRTHTTILWYYYLKDQEVLRELETNGEV
jgi:phenylalanyl-tRNA synthetase alpha chain